MMEFKTGAGALISTRSRWAAVHSPQRITGPFARVKAPAAKVPSGSMDSAMTASAAPAIASARGPRNGVAGAPRPCVIS
ncbi:hypothetical protein D3C71_1921860 [compost metagenome]